MNSFNFEILKAQEENIQSIQLFLEENKLRPKINIDNNSIYFLIKHESAIIGTIGAEINSPYALIKSAGVSMEWRKKGIAQKLFEHLKGELQHIGVKELYLFSRQAPEFWTRMGFHKCEIEDIMNKLPETNQVKEFIADNSIWTDVAWHRAIIET